MVDSPAGSSNPGPSSSRECIEVENIGAGNGENSKIVASLGSNITPPTLLNPELGVPATIERAASTTHENGEGLTSPLMSNADVPMADLGSSQTLATIPSTTITLDTPASSIPPTSAPAVLTVSAMPNTSNSDLPTVSAMPNTSNSDLLTDGHSKDGVTNNDQLSPTLSEGGGEGGGVTNDGLSSTNNGAIRDDARGASDGNGSVELSDTTTLSLSSGGMLTFSGGMLTLSGWLKDSAEYFWAILTDKHWQDLISKWLIFEQCCQIEGVSHDSSGTSNRTLKFL